MWWRPAALASSGKPANPDACSAAMAKTNLSPDYQQKVLSGAPDAELHTYNQALPLMMVRYMGPGLLGLGITALIAGFMSGMAGNVSAFSTVWTYDIYKPLINKKATDSHYVMVGRLSIVVGVIVSIGAAYLVQQFHGIMDYVQALFSIFVAPLLGTILSACSGSAPRRWPDFWACSWASFSRPACLSGSSSIRPDLRYMALSDASQADG